MKIILDFLSSTYLFDDIIMYVLYGFMLPPTLYHVVNELYNTCNLHYTNKKGGLNTLLIYFTTHI